MSRKPTPLIIERQEIAYILHDPDGTPFAVPESIRLDNFDARKLAAWLLRFADWYEGRK